jgi:hypothetical protein
LLVQLAVTDVSTVACIPVEGVESGCWYFFWCLYFSDILAASIPGDCRHLSCCSILLPIIHTVTGLLLLSLLIFLSFLLLLSFILLLSLLLLGSLLLLAPLPLLTFSAAPSFPAL